MAKVVLRQLNIPGLDKAVYSCINVIAQRKWKPEDVEMKDTVTEKGVEDMMKQYSEWYGNALQTGIAEGKFEGMFTAAKNVMASTHSTFEDALNLLQIPAEEHPKYQQAFEAM